MHQERMTHKGTRFARLAPVLLALCASAASAQGNYEDWYNHNRYFGAPNYGVRAESMAHVLRRQILIVRQAGAEIAHRDTVRLFGRNLTAFHGNVAVLGSKVIGAPATGRALSTASLVNGRFTYTPFDVNLREGVEASPSRRYTRDILSWEQTFWIGILPVRLEVSAGGVFDVYARRTRVTSSGISPTVRTTLGASAAITGRGFAGLGADLVVVSGRAGVELRLNLAQVTLESPCSVGWNGVDMPVNLRFSNRIRLLLTAEASGFNPFDWDEFEWNEDGSLLLVDYTFADRSWQLTRFRVQ